MNTATQGAPAGYQEYEAWASEGSHAGFAPRGELQQELLRFAEEELELPCEVEHVACGIGLTRIYRFLCHKRGIQPQSLVPPPPSAGDCMSLGLKVELFGSRISPFWGNCGVDQGHAS